MKKQPEYILACQICDYLNKAYSNVQYMTDTIASVYLRPAQANRNKRVQKSGFHCPDLIIFAPRGKYHALFIELKVITPFKKDGSIKASSGDHLRNQLKTINYLTLLDYKACFSWGFDMTRKIIDDYLKPPL